MSNKLLKVDNKSTRVLSYPTGIYLFKANYENTREIVENVYQS